MLTLKGSKGYAGHAASLKPLKKGNKKIPDKVQTTSDTATSQLNANHLSINANCVRYNGDESFILRKVQISESSVISFQLSESPPVAGHTMFPAMAER